MMRMILLRRIISLLFLWDRWLKRENIRTRLTTIMSYALLKRCMIWINRAIMIGRLLLVFGNRLKMNKLSTLLLLFVGLALAIPKESIAQDREPIDYVNVLMGTLSKYELSNGNTYPVIARPWGMNFWTPQTGKMGDGWIYQYTADKINGFKQTHQPSPWNNDYGQFALMPVTGTPEFNIERRASWFSHKAEVAAPNY